MIIRTRNNLAEQSPKTYLTNPEVAGTSVLRWKNPNAFSAQWAVQVGETGESQTEIALLSSSIPAGTAGTLTGTTLYEHPSDTPLYAVKWDQIVFERSTAGTAGTATPLSGGTITLQPSNLYTQYDDTSGSATYAYKTFFRNSLLSVNSTESDWIMPTGFTFFALGGIRQRIRDRLWNADYLKDDLIIDNWINEWKDEMTNAAIQVNEDYSIGTVGVAFGTNGLGTITSNDFKQARRVWVTYDGINKFNSGKMASNSYLPSTTFVSTQPKHDWQGDRVFQVHPSDTAGTAEIEYYKLNANLVNDGDELPNPMKGYTKSFVDYAEARAYAKDGKWEAYDRLMAMAQQAKTQFVSESSPRDKTGPSYIKITEPIEGNDYWPPR